MIPKMNDSCERFFLENQKYLQLDQCSLIPDTNDSYELFLLSESKIYMQRSLIHRKSRLRRYNMLMTTFTSHVGYELETKVHFGLL